MNIVYDTLLRIADTSSRKEKEAILLEAKESKYAPIFEKVFSAAYDPRVDYYIKEFETPEPTEVVCVELDEAIDSLSVISQRQFTGNLAKSWLMSHLNTLTEQQQSIVSRIIKRDLRCGISATTINKVFTNLIYQHPYMRCDSFSEKSLKNITFPCYSQIKIDGLYCDIIVTENEVNYVSRNGANLRLNDSNRDQVLLDYADENSSYVISGEVIVTDENGDIIPRQESNGYINSDDRDMDRISFCVWDIVDYNDFKKASSSVDYESRLNQLLKFVDDTSISDHNVSVVETIECESVDQIVDHFASVRQCGLEGVIIKDQSGLWKHGTSKHQIKVKVVIDVDLKLVGYRMGEGRHEGTIGSVGLESSDGLVSVYAGTGLKDKDRLELVDTIDDLIERGAICKIKCNGLIRNKEDDNWTLFLPVFVEIRSDKTDADDYAKIRESEDSFLDMLKLIE